MKPRAYIETTIISYLTARASRDVVIAGRQQVTREWWENAGDRFDLVASELVMNEAGGGDAEAAADRLAAMADVVLLDATEEAAALASRLIECGAVPEKAAEDAAHIAIAVTSGVEYMVTWNCRHIANAAMRSRIERICQDAGYEPTIICTPEELMDDDDENDHR